jgi:hypothetical protein
LICRKAEHQEPADPRRDKSEEPFPDWTRMSQYHRHSRWLD